MTSVFLNGQFFGGPDDPPISAARIAAFDAGVQHGVGLFETMLGGVLQRGVEGANAHGELVETWVLQLDEHMERLAASAQALGLTDQLRTAALAEAVIATVKRSGLARARVRLTLTGGDLAMLASVQSAAASAQGGGAQGAQAQRGADPTVMIVAQPATAYPRAMFERGVSLMLAEARVNPLNPFEGHKTLNYWWRLRELQRAARAGAGEALMLSVSNHVAGGCVSNVFIVKGEEVLTPLARGDGETGDTDELGNVRKTKTEGRIPSAVLPGITRSWAMSKAERLGYSCEARMLSVQDVLDADEVFLTNSSWGVLPAVKLEVNAIGAGTPGRLTLDLRDAWMALQPTITE
jgi:branched-subunit amino acid aminotransferase/4-amino-4-deoxychorismate lyase